MQVYPRKLRAIISCLPMRSLRGVQPKNWARFSHSLFMAHRHEKKWDKVQPYVCSGHSNGPLKRELSALKAAVGVLWNFFETMGTKLCCLFLAGKALLRNSIALNGEAKNAVFPFIKVVGMQGNNEQWFFCPSSSSSIPHVNNQHHFFTEQGLGKCGWFSTIFENY